MFVGHFGLGFAAKRAVPGISLGTLFLASQFIDLLWPTLLVVGLETVEVAPGATRMTPLRFTSYPISHSLVAVLCWSVLFGLVYFALRRRAAAAMACAALVTSHWMLDVIVHEADLPLLPGGGLAAGFGLWNVPQLALGVEAMIFGVGVFLYVAETEPCDRIGVAAFWALVAFLVVAHLANVFGPPPPDANAVAWAGHAQWLLVAWGFWIDRHRRPRTA